MFVFYSVSQVLQLVNNGERRIEIQTTTQSVRSGHTSHILKLNGEDGNERRLLSHKVECISIVYDSASFQIIIIQGNSSLL